MQQLRRRTFLKNASTMVVSSSLIGTAQSWAGANDRIRVAVIGLGGRGRGHIREASSIEGVEVVTLCDPDETRMAKAAAELEAATGKKARLEPDLRKIIEDSSIDVVSIATCNHWHALATVWACQANKHVFVEKPVSHTFIEGEKMVEAARKYKRVVQAGTQRRSNGSFRKVIQLLHEGIIGDIYMARSDYPEPRDPIGFKSAEAPPPWLDWNLWLGPAPKQPYHGNLVHYNWHWFWDFGGGEIGNNGPHFLDITRWGMKKGLPSRIQSVGGRFGPKDQGETPNTQRSTFVYEDGTSIISDIRGLYTTQGFTWDFYGTKGHMHIKPRHIGKNYGCEYQVFLGRNKTPEPDMGVLENMDHYRNFIEAVRSGKSESLTADVEESHLSGALCILANISYRLGRELNFDPKTKRFVNDSEANRLLTREYREPFVVPDKV